MSTAATAEQPLDRVPEPAPGRPADPAVAEPAPELDLLVEDVSIDGMCGVY